MKVIYWAYGYATYEDAKTKTGPCTWSVSVWSAGWDRFDCACNECVWIVPGTIDPSA